MENKKIRVGIIGTGKWTVDAHLPAFLSAKEDAEVVALCNLHIEKAKRVGEQFSITSIYDNLEEMIEKENLDVLDIVTSRGEHFIPSCAAIDHGLHILCEKPIGHTLEEARILADKIKDTNIIHHVGFTFRYSPVARYAKKLIDEGAIGEIYHVQGFEQNGQLIDEDTPLPRRGFSKKTDSGALHGYGSHLIDLCRWLCGEVEYVIGNEETYIKNRKVKESPDEILSVSVDDSTMWMCKYNNGAQGVMQASKVAIGNAPGVEVRIYGSKASIWIRLVETPDGFDKMWMATRADMDFKPVFVSNDFMDDNWPKNYYSILVKDFIKRVKENDCSKGVGDYYDGLKCQEIIAAIEKSFDTKSWVNVRDFS